MKTLFERPSFRHYNSAGRGIMVDYSDYVRNGVAARRAISEIAEEVFLSFPPIGFSENWEIFHSIRKKVSLAFDVPVTSVHVCGSCQLGVSPVKFTPFDKGRSDLDLAIVDARLFAKLLAESKTVTNGFRDLTSFAVRKGVPDSPQFMKNISMSGMLRPDLMPRCQAKSLWFSAFEKISNDYLDWFKKISGGVYVSEYFFASRQIAALEKMKEGL